MRNVINSRFSKANLHEASTLPQEQAKKTSRFDLGQSKPEHSSRFKENQNKAIKEIQQVLDLYNKGPENPETAKIRDQLENRKPTCNRYYEYKNRLAVKKSSEIVNLKKNTRYDQYKKSATEVDTLYQNQEEKGTQLRKKITHQVNQNYYEISNPNQDGKLVKEYFKKPDNYRNPNRNLYQANQDLAKKKPMKNNFKPDNLEEISDFNFNAHCAKQLENPNRPSKLNSRFAPTTSKQTNLERRSGVSRFKVMADELEKASQDLDTFLKNLKEF